MYWDKNSKNKFASLIGGEATMPTKLQANKNNNFSFYSQFRKNIHVCQIKKTTKLMGTENIFMLKEDITNNGDSKSNVSLSILKELSEIQHPFFARMM